MGIYVIETDAPCLRCGDTHNYVTSTCTLCVFVDYGTAYYVARSVSGSIVREISEVPDGLSYTMYMHKNGRPDRGLPTTVGPVSGR